MQIHSSVHSIRFKNALLCVFTLKLMVKYG